MRVRKGDLDDLRLNEDFPGLAVKRAEDGPDLREFVGQVRDDEGVRAHVRADTSHVGGQRRGHLRLDSVHLGVIQLKNFRFRRQYAGDGGNIRLF